MNRDLDKEKKGAISGDIRFFSMLPPRLPLEKPTDRNHSFLTCVVFSLEALLLYSVIINS